MGNLESTRYELFTAPKRGHAPDENEDAAAVGIAPERIRAAVADGATESIFSRVWAQNLVRAFVGSLPEEPPGEWLSAARSAFENDVAVRRPGLPWYAAEKAEQGAHASFLGVEFSRDGSWTCIAVGDCCLFQLRGDSLMMSWPYTDPAAFHNRPDLLPSEQADFHFSEKTGRWEPGDVFLLATDAVSAWLLARADWAPGAGPLFDSIARSHERGDMRNDDATCLHLALAP